ncbi:MAG: GAF domain-containing protein [Alphaproteobacteria bacterium]|nr:GAF domain-containing protein [Alphaproteobacteria bacterium]
MGTFSISSRGLQAVEVEAPNWIAALGLGLEALQRADGLERLACEVLPNGTVIARDVQTGTGFVVMGIDPAVDEEVLEELVEVEVEPLTEEEIEVDSREALVHAIREADSPASAASLALTLARDHVPAESGAVILEDRGYLRFVSVVGPHARRLIGVRLPLGTGVAGFAMQKERVVVLDQAHEDPRHCGEVDALTGYTTEQIAVLPIRAGGRCYGVLELMNLGKGRRFEPDRVKALREVADLLAERLSQG